MDAETFLTYLGGSLSYALAKEPQDAVPCQNEHEGGFGDFPRPARFEHT